MAPFLTSLLKGIWHLRTLLFTDTCHE